MRPQPIYLSDYQPPKFAINHVYLYFELGESVTYVTSVLEIARNNNAEADEPLELDGDNLSLQSIVLDSKELSEDDFNDDGNRLVVFNVPDQFTLETKVALYPQNNKQLMGLYQSSGNFCTQCEPHGFSRITYFLDRPDVMSSFTTAIAADGDQYPYLLSNGNLVDDKVLSDGRRWVKWHDPSLKPCYLFALVAGDFELIEDHFVTQSGRDVALRLFVEKGYGDQGSHAIESLKRAMRWDEQTFGREYDLDVYMMVAVSDFNMGAMENKGLNVFNTQYILAKPESATDHNYMAIEEVIGHEYFHNWTGNRITLRDWFQLSLKEGLTIFREQWFGGDMTSPAVQRIEDADIIRTAQFAEDAGPTAHPVRPQSYIEINNFYTLTVYHKGAELARMMYYLMGPEKFRQGMDLYFDRHDGRAVTTDDFVQALEDGGQYDLSQFRRWYDQAGTPVVTVDGHYDAEKGQYDLTVEQHCPATADGSAKEPFVIPMAMGLVGTDGQDLALQLDNESEPRRSGTRVLQIDDHKHHFRFKHIDQRPVPSLFRHFSAPVKCRFDYSDDELIFLYQHDNDDYNRWQAGQTMMARQLKRLVEAYGRDEVFHFPERFLQAIRSVLQNETLDKSLIAKALQLPKVQYMVHEIDHVDMDALMTAYDYMHRTIAEYLYDELWQVYDNCHQPGAEYVYDNRQVGQRELKNVCLNYLMETATQQEKQLARQQFDKAKHMTDTMGALNALNRSNTDERFEAMERFHQTWRHHTLVLDKWFSLEATARLPDALDRVKELMDHADFEPDNPNKIRALIGGFVRGNPRHFHASDGSGYRFLKDQILRIDRFNPQIAARLAEPLSQWHQFDDHRQQLMYEELETIAKEKNLSNDLYEIVNKALKFHQSQSQAV